MNRLTSAVISAALGMVTLAGSGADAFGVGAGPAETTEVAAPSGSAREVEAPTQSSSVGLAGKVIVIDAGHQLGNHNFPAEISRPVPAGGFTKPCNTTGTATNGGYAEATFAWRVTVRLKAKLEKSGATVILTRTSNREDRWGPCVDVRGRAGNRVHADLKISVHGDGSTASGAQGFHVIHPPNRAPWTADIHRPSKRLAHLTREALLGKGFSVAGYIAGGDGLDVRSDLATLNLSDVPAVMVELGNMRDPTDAALMTSSAGQARYAAALGVAVREFCGVVGRPAVARLARRPFPARTFLRFFSSSGSGKVTNPS